MSSFFFWWKYEYDNLVPNKPHKKLQLYIRFIEFFIYYYLNSPIRSTQLMNPGELFVPVNTAQNIKRENYLI